MKRTRAEIQADLDDDLQRMTELNVNGVGALSHYDITICYKGNAKKALYWAKWLVGNHIEYHKWELAEAAPEQENLFAISAQQGRNGEQ